MPLELHLSAAGAMPSRPIATNGDALLGAPWSFTASAEYHFPDWAGRLPYARGTFSTRPHRIRCSRDRTRTTRCSTPPCRDCRSSTICRCGPGLRFIGFDVSAYANNVTNAASACCSNRAISRRFRARRVRAPASSVRLPTICTSRAAYGREPSALPPPTAIDDTRRGGRKASSPAADAEDQFAAFPCHTASVSGDPWARTPLSVRISSVAAMIACRENTKASPPF